MEQNPLHSQDLNHGVPPVFNEILDELLDETTAMFAEEHEMEQAPMRKMESTGSTSKTELEK